MKMATGLAVLTIGGGIGLAFKASRDIAVLGERVENTLKDDRIAKLHEQLLKMNETLQDVRLELTRLEQAVANKSQIPPP